MRRHYQDGLIALAALWVAVCGAGCQHAAFSEFDQRATALDAQRLYDSLHVNHGALLAALETVEHEPVVYDLRPRGARRDQDAALADPYWNEDKAVFFHVPAEAGAAYTGWLYFSPRNQQVVALEAGAPLPAGSDIVRRAAGGFSLFRAIAVDTAKPFARDRLALFRFDFHLTPDHDLAATGRSRLTRASGTHAEPIPIPEAWRVVYRHRDDSEDPSRLMVTDFDGADTWPLLAEQEFDTRHLRLLSDGRLVFAGDRDGAYRLYQCAGAGERVAASAPEAPLAADTVTRFVYPFPETDPAGRLFLGNVAGEGALQPALLKLPEVLDLDGIHALVTAHNPAVNERRAALAAALVEIQQEGLPLWPVLNVGLGYESAVEVFNNLTSLATGDTLSRSLRDATAGIAQPLLDFPRQRALTEAARWRAESARHQLANEINERVAEAAGLFFEARYLRHRLALDEDLLAVARRRAEYYDGLRTLGESTRVQQLAIGQVAEGIRSEQSFHERRLNLVVSRLKELCGLPGSAPIQLATEPFALAAFEPPGLDELRQTALLNHPRPKAARGMLASAFYLRQAGPDIRPAATASGRYEVVDREFNRVEMQPTPGGGSAPVTVDDERVDEFVSLALTGQIPLASFKARKLSGAFWDETIQSLALAHAGEARRVETAVEEAYVDFMAAARDYRAKKSSVEYFLELLRVARLYHELGPPDTRITVTRPVDEPGPTIETVQSDVLAPVTARFEYLQAIDKVRRVEMDLGQRFANLWREMGLAAQLPEALEARRASRRDQESASLWLWRTKPVIGDDESMAEFLELARERGIQRVYAYMYSDSHLLADRKWREKMLAFINLCAASDIAVWGLLGEPEWLTYGGTDALAIASRRIKAFNESAGNLEPRLAGVKLDIEPHGLPGWDDDADVRAKLSREYLGLVRTAREALGGDIPLWVDVPVKFFWEENEALVESLGATVDGATIMTYFDSENAIVKWAGIALDQFAGPVEAGIEFSTRAPKGDRIAEWPPARLRAFQERLVEAYGDRDNFAGMAYHDYEGVAAYWNGEGR